MNICDYNGFTMDYIPNSSNYLTEYNSKYGTSYTPISYIGKTNTNGNVSKFQMYCPDGVHPHTDRTGKSTDILAYSVTKLLRDL